jgi:hypothetical protein
VGEWAAAPGNGWDMRWAARAHRPGGATSGARKMSRGPADRWARWLGGRAGGTSCALRALGREVRVGRVRGCWVGEGAAWLGRWRCWWAAGGSWPRTLGRGRGAGPWEGRVLGRKARRGWVFLFLSYFFIFCSFLPFSFPIRI